MKFKNVTKDTMVIEIKDRSIATSKYAMTPKEIDEYLRQERVLNKSLWDWEVSDVITANPKTYQVVLELRRSGAKKKKNKKFKLF